MINEKEYRLIDKAFFIMGFYNPSPGNPEIRTFEFDEKFLYAVWEDGDKTKTQIDKVEKIYKKGDEEEIGIYLWFGEDHIYLSRIHKRYNEDEDEYEELDDDEDLYDSGDSPFDDS